VRAELQAQRWIAWGLIAFDLADVPADVKVP